MSVYLAVDAGGAKTECVIADENRVLSRVTGDTVHFANGGATEAETRLRTMLRQTSSQAGIPLYLVTRACMGLANDPSDGVHEWARAALREQLTGELVVTSSEDIALEAAFGHGPGVMVIAGAGARVIGRCANGSRFTTGGWGPVLGDEGSGHWIGLEGLRTGLRALDRGLASNLLREISVLWGVQGVGALLARVNGTPVPDFASLAEVVTRCAAQGDVLARSVLERAGQELAAQVRLVIGRMKTARCDSSDAGRIAFAGNVLARIGPVYQAMIAALESAGVKAAVDEQATEPVMGALARARRG